MMQSWGSLLLPPLLAFFFSRLLASEVSIHQEESRAPSPETASEVTTLPEEARSQGAKTGMEGILESWRSLRNGFSTAITWHIFLETLSL